VRHRISALLSKRSVLRRRQYPSRANSIMSLLFIILALPLALLVLPIVVLLTIFKRRRLHLAVLDIDNEFAPFIEIMEFLRAGIDVDAKWDFLLILSKYSHILDDLYAEQFKSLIIRRHGFSGLVQQVLLLQPTSVLSVTRLVGGRTFSLPDSELPVSDALISLRNKTLNDLGLNHDNFVAMAVFTLQYDEERDLREARKVAILESYGDGLVAGVDYLRESDIGVVLLGSPDTKRAKVPREIPRLSAFGRLGGAHEVALASGCNYFWNDSDVGAWWLGLPFRRPILTTNKPRIRLRTDFTGYEHLVVPVRYQRLDGSFLTFRELLSMKSAPFKAASDGNLLMVRNSSDEVVEAHKELRARIAGTWSEDPSTKDLRERCMKVFSEFPDTLPMRISEYFLRSHPYLLD